MYYSNKTTERILASLLLLSITLCMHAVSNSTAVGGIAFSPWGQICADSVAVLSSEVLRAEVSEIPVEYEANCRVLIYHTHTTEAYLQNPENRYENLAGRSDKPELTVKQVGEVLSKSFAQLGFDAHHDTANNEAQGYNNAYGLSDRLITDNIERNGEYLIHIDLHRDAYSKNTSPVVEIDGESVAKIMFVVGGKTSNSAQNQAFAAEIARELNNIHPELCEKVLVKSGSHFNQMHSDRSLLIEVGDNAVTVEEACRSAEYVAKAIGIVVGKTNKK